MTLTKRDLVTRISDETGLVQQQVLDVVQKTLDYIAESLAKGDKVELRNFGVFEVKVRKARIGRNPNAPETDVPIPNAPSSNSNPARRCAPKSSRSGPNPPARRRKSDPQSRLRQTEPNVKNETVGVCCPILSLDLSVSMFQARKRR